MRYAESRQLRRETRPVTRNRQPLTIVRHAASPPFKYETRPRVVVELAQKHLFVILGNYRITMENYYKGKNIEEELERSKIPIQGLPENFLWMQVKGGSKMNNLLSHSSGILQDKAARAVVWTGAGVAISKAISCAEILKRQFSIEHQITQICYKKVEEFWEPKIDGLETIVVKRQIPVIHIFLSLDPISGDNQLGYQTLKSSRFWENSQSNSFSNKQQSQQKFKKPFKYKTKSSEIKT
ncbi:Ribonuclease P protein subunit p25-like protein [Eumeta japonica]|uniref:Ribonuclease P protein subunit p25-like protein n=1 Tax=Eumeta variegata TaxID=151549 RepID=A0A4C1X816_EUMVA|nr:Ribonuclease P protein subunit p25-like protein [Eumeta japonica]